MLAIAAAKLGWTPVRGYDHEPAALEAAAANAAANGVELDLERMNLREQLPALAPTVVANMTSPILKAVAVQLEADGERGRSADPPQPLSGGTPWSPTARLLGALAGGAGRGRRRFQRNRPGEADRRQDGDWAALLLRRG